ncbi:hypothetical protein Afil01_34220 [Actinorhabdospora filicis]|uniref:Uncharacterized protein n=1 Tax=Actinorhabdospora filicis TaxID=1785913 RepID=A0A9W6SMH5_9ACTN|nr:hypothetical protein [Actinorhabdospora filicis]GLZ78615.1 hypothetical protein Afil01_34220 [Actinorhabdospora filicis]
MPLGPDKTVCATELREAMRAYLDTLDPPAGSNVDKPEVRPNFDALGQGVYKILTADAETVSDTAADSPYWTYVTALRNEVEQLRAFAAGVRAAFTSWDPANPATNAALRTAITGLAVPGSTPAAPTTQKGRLR